MIDMKGQATLRMIGIAFWIIAIIILMATYGVFAKPQLESQIKKGVLESDSIYYNGSLVFCILLLTMGTFLMIYPIKKKIS